MAVRRAFTLVELLVVVAIIVILMSILLPVLIAARNKVRQAVCMSNLKQIGMAISIYSDDHDGMFPIGAYTVIPLPPASPFQFSWRDTLLQGRYVTHLGIFSCPSANSIDYRAAFGINFFLAGWQQAIKSESINWPAYTVLITEKQGLDWPAWPPNLQGTSKYFQPLDVRHNNESINVLYADGHVGQRSIGDLIVGNTTQIVWKP